MATVDTTGVKYFNAVTSNKMKECKLKETEMKIDESRKRALIKYWKDKFDILDDLVLLNVKTSRYSKKKTEQLKDDSLPEEEADGQADDSSGKIRLSEMQMDSKLLTNKPMTIGKGKEPGLLKPVIEIVGSDAICYPNSEAKRGRTVRLNYTTRRRLEAAKHHEQALVSLEEKKLGRQASGTSLNNFNDRHKLLSKRPLTSRISKGGLVTECLSNRPKTSMK